MINTSNVHEKLIKKLPALSNDVINQLKILSSYEDAILLPNNKIIDLSKYSFNVEDTQYSLNLPSNKSNSIFYFDENIGTGNYYEIEGFKYLIKKEFQQQLRYYNINIEYRLEDDIGIELFILEYENNEIINIIKINENTDFQTLENTEYFKVCTKFSGTGLIYNINIQVVEKQREILNEMTINFKADDFYNTAKELEIIQTNDGVNISVDKNDKKHIYISYAENNNKFTLIPVSNIFENITFDKELMTNLSINKDDTLEVIPMLIEYNEEEKLSIKNLSVVNQEILNFKEETKNVRFVLRISGTGEMNLKSFSLLELEEAPKTINIDFENRKDVISLITPQMKLKDFKVACIMDEFTFNSFNPEVQLHKLTINKWKSEILFIQPDLVFIESAWVGNDGQWNKKVAYYDEEQHAEIKSLIEFSKSLDIPVVFWNKEDPVHYDRFIETAKLCDFIFTTDKGRVTQYIKDCGHKNVAPLPFAAQPKNHNPIKIQNQRDSRVSFAGSYYRHHEERSKDMDLLLEASKDIGLVIYDRNYEKTSKGQMPNHMYPERYKPYVKGSLPFNLIDKSYKGYKYMINVNTVKHSETMFSRRVFEGLISGTPIISTYSLGMKMMFGDIIESSSKIEDLKNHLRKLDSDELIYNKYALRGIREVLINHTYESRMKKILQNVGYRIKSNKTNVYFIAFINNDDEIKEYIDIFNSQTVNNKKLVLLHKNILNFKEFYNEFNTETIIGIDYTALDKYINVRQLLGDGYITVLNHRHYYSKNYALDLILAKEYAEADVIGKSMYYSLNDEKIKLNNKNSDYMYTSNIFVDRAVINIKIFDKFSMETALKYLEGKDLLESLIPFGAKLFSTDSLNFIENGINSKEKDKFEV